MTLKEITNSKEKTNKENKNKENVSNINFADCLTEEESEEENVFEFQLKELKVHKEEKMPLMEIKNIKNFKKIKSIENDRMIKYEEKQSYQNMMRNRKYNNVKIKYKPQTDFSNIEKPFNRSLNNSSEIIYKTEKREGKRVYFAEKSLDSIINTNDQNNSNKRRVNASKGILKEGVYRGKQPRKKVKEVVIVNCQPLFDNVQEDLTPFHFKEKD